MTSLHMPSDASCHATILQPFCNHFLVLKLSHSIKNHGIGLLPTAMDHDRVVVLKANLIIVSLQIRG